jgi:hypothetical protein
MADTSQLFASGDQAGVIDEFSPPGLTIRLRIYLNGEGMQRVVTAR